MKICPNCQQKYTDDGLNFCLSDGGILTPVADEPPPTVLMSPARSTNQNWSNEQPFSQPWQDPQPLSPQQNQPFMTPTWTQGQDQTLPTVALVLGILSLLLICCYGGFYFGIAAAICGFLGMNNANNKPEVYGGKGLAVAGLIMGGISFLLTLLMLIFAILGNIK